MNDAARSAWLLACAVLTSGGLVLPAAADSPARAPLPPSYVEECGSCHVAYPARFLGRSSWDALLAGLGEHFGTDASIDPQALEAVRVYLQTGARSGRTERSDEPLLRITEAAWFRHEHPRPDAAVWARPDVRSPANCGACHRQAESGRYGERSLRVPKGDAR